jgi:hypothetical protein
MTARQLKDRGEIDMGHLLGVDETVVAPLPATSIFRKSCKIYRVKPPRRPQTRHWAIWTIA